MLSRAWGKERSCLALFHGMAVSVSVGQKQDKNAFPAALGDGSEQSRSSKGVACAKLNPYSQPVFPGAIDTIDVSIVSNEVEAMARCTQGQENCPESCSALP